VVGVGRFSKWDDSIDKALKLTSLEQSAHSDQFFLIRLHDKECFFDALIIGPLALGGNGDHAAQSRIPRAFYFAEK
jgi:hypothetical protein